MMNAVLNELYKEGLIQDFVDKGYIAWVIYKNLPFIVLAPYGMRWTFNIYTLNSQEEIRSCKDTSLEEGLNKLYWVVKNRYSSLDFLDRIDENPNVFVTIESNIHLLHKIR